MKNLLIILDGWGITSQQVGNAVLKAKTPCFDYLATNHPYALLDTSSEKVGLSWGVWGNSETGHATIGSGRVLWQYLEEIDNGLKEGKFASDFGFNGYLEDLQSRNKALHIIALFSDGNVHSNYREVIEFARIAQTYLNRIWLHIITDGRDTEPKNAKKYINSLYSHSHILDFNKIKIATMIGRYFAMDRDNNWDRTAIAYNLIVNRQAKINNDKPRIAINQNYQMGYDDEKMAPTIVDPNYQFVEGDGVFFANFRADRFRQLVRAFGERNFKGFRREYIHSKVLTLTDYLLPYVSLKVLYPREIQKNTLSEVFSKNGNHQLHIAETEKYAHITYFFDGGNEKPFIGQKNQIVPSLKVASYDLKPEMSIVKLTKILNQEIPRQKYQFIVVNYANADMVGHTGNFQATIEACEAVDKNLKSVYENAIKNQYAIFLTADHGNADSMLNPTTFQPNKEHTTNPVPFMIVDSSNKKNMPQTINNFYSTPPIGILADIAPTILDHSAINKPAEMTGESLLKSLS